MRARWWPLCGCGYFVLFLIILSMLGGEPEKPFEFDVEIPSKHYFNCTNIHEIKIRSRIGAGYSKQAYSGYYKAQPVVVKSVSQTSHDVTSCIDGLRSDYKKIGRSEPHDKMLWRCTILPHMKLLKEVLFMEQLYHPNIIPLLGYCVRNEKPGDIHTSLKDHGAVAVYKYGDELRMYALKRLPVYRRLVAAIEFADLMQYLQFSPLGSLLFADFKTMHFLLVDGHVMLIDFDDVSDLEPSCDNNMQTSTKEIKHNKQREPCTFGIQCKSGFCDGFNALHNLKRTCYYFIQPLLETIRWEEKQFGDSFQTDYEIIMSYLTAIEQSMENMNDKTQPPTALELKKRLVRLQRGMLHSSSGRETTTSHSGAVNDTARNHSDTT